MAMYRGFPLHVTRAGCPSLHIFMCVVCNPACGKCRPIRRRAVTCVECGTVAMVDGKCVLAGQATSCPKCKASLPMPNVPKLSAAGRLAMPEANIRGNSAAR